jgi:hypothetical protein
MSEMARHWIDGAWLESELVADSYNPATGGLFGRFADGGEDEARAAVGAARRAFAVTDWGRDRALRSRALLELAEGFEAHAQELALILTRENGKPWPKRPSRSGAGRNIASQCRVGLDRCRHRCRGGARSVFQQRGRAGRRGRGHRAVECTGGAGHPFPRPCARRREYRRGKAAWGRHPLRAFNRALAVGPIEDDT